jgi:hypothetical protein
MTASNDVTTDKKKKDQNLLIPTFYLSSVKYMKLQICEMKARKHKIKSVYGVWI